MNGLLRRGEAAALRWDDLAIEDEGSGRLVVQRSKTDQTGEATERWRKVAGASLPGLCQVGWWQSPAMVVRYTRSQAADRSGGGRYYRRF